MNEKLANSKNLQIPAMNGLEPDESYLDKIKSEIPEIRDYFSPTFQCKFCTRRFATKDGISKHLVSAHENETITKTAKNIAENKYTPVTNQNLQSNWTKKHIEPVHENEAINKTTKKSLENVYMPVINQYLQSGLIKKCPSIYQEKETQR